MKKLFALILCTLVLTGCKAPEPSEAAANPIIMVSEPVETMQSTMETAANPLEAACEITLYLPNEDATGFTKTSCELPELTIFQIFAALQGAGVLNDDAAANSLEMDGTKLLLDVNDAFWQQLNGYGTSGEYYMMGSVVNTLLKAYQAETVQITHNGQIMETGHIVYDYPLVFYPEI